MHRDVPVFDYGPGREDEAPTSNKALFDFGTASNSRPLKQMDVLDQLLVIQEYERQRMGQELHDSAGQLIVCLQLSIARLRREDPEHEAQIQEIQDIVSEINQQVRSLAFLHYPVELTNQGLATAVEMLVRGFGYRTGTKTTFTEVGDLAGLEHSRSAALLRVAQEALVNIHRHSRASSARVSLKRREHSVELSVCDDGVGLPQFPTHTRGIGLQSMRYRIETLGGCFRTTNLKRGTKIFASFPFGE